MVALSRTMATSGKYAAPQERECSRLLAVLEETGTPLLSLRYGCGDEIYRADEVGRGLYVLTEGVAKLFVSYRAYAGGKDATFLLLGSEESFGYPLCGGGRPGRVSVEAFTDCEVVKIPGVFVEQATRRRPEIALEIATLLERRLVEYEELVGCLLPRMTEIRLARMLLILAHKFDEAPGDSRVDIGLRLTHSDLAQMVAATREPVTAAMARLRKKHILDVDKGCIGLLDPEMPAEVGSQ